MGIIETLIIVCATAVVVWVLARIGNSRQAARTMLLQTENDTLKAQAEQLQRQTEELRQQHSVAITERERYATQAETYDKQAQRLQAAIDRQKEEHRSELEAQAEKMGEEFARQSAELKALYEKQKTETDEHYRRQLDEMRQQQAKQMEQQAELIKEQINTASETILKKRSEELTSKNSEQLSAILNPMREAVERNDRDQADRMVKLDATIKENLRQAKEVGERADKLAQALTSENKVQGNFGELQLRTLLENMGLEEGVQFEEQTTMRDEQGKSLRGDDSGCRMIPDVILHFPGNRDVIIDAKMSLKAFEDYHNAETDEERAQALERHITSVRNHIKELAAKRYYEYTGKGKAKLDFVMMYIYSESALQLALANAPDIWKSAYDQGVIISGSQTLYMMLRVLEMTWRQVRQAENQEEIMKTANELVNRVQLFYERFQAADDMLVKTRHAFDEVKGVTAPAGKSIATSARKLIKMGAKENLKRKARLPLPVEEAEEEDAD